MSQQSMADLLSTPPAPKNDNGAPRDWRTVRIGELIKEEELRFVDMETTVEAACQVLQTTRSKLLFIRMLTSVYENI